MCPTAQDAQLPQDDETRRLVAAFEACRAKELAAADQLSKPRHRREMNHVVRSRPVQAQVMVAERIGYSVQEEPSS